MKATYIDYKDTNSFSKTLLAYLDNDPELASFSGNRPTFEGFAKQIQTKKGKTNRKVLVDSLSEQYDGVNVHTAVTDNINALLNEQTFTVTTGHQLNIFTGPLYFIFKIATAIRLAQDLQAEFPDCRFVPVYWMATEDHDFAEINHTQLHGKRVAWDTAAKGATGRMLTDTMEDVVRQYEGLLGLSENSTRLTELIKAAYLGHTNLA